jgi:nucleoside-diphosphate kinase
MSYTFSIIKPDAVSKGHYAAILRRINNAGFSILGNHRIQLTKEQAKDFYSVHEGKPFYEDLIKFMVSGPIYVLLLISNGNTVDDFRKLIGETDPKDAASGTIRNLYGTDIGHNAIHGADSSETAREEIAFFFPQYIDYIGKLII